MREYETDFDVNEDIGRERQLDDSFDTWYNQMEVQSKQADEIIRVPQSNAFEAATDLDEGER